jgi:hypothetical protein
MARIGYGTYDMIKECHRFKMMWLEFRHLEIGKQFFVIPNPNSRPYTKHSKIMANDNVDRFRFSPTFLIYINK